MLSLYSVSSSEFLITLDDKHYKQSINIQEYTDSENRLTEPSGVVGEYGNAISYVNDLQLS